MGCTQSRTGAIVIGLNAWTTKDREVQIQNELGQVLEVFRSTQLQHRWELNLLTGVYSVSLAEEGAVVETAWVVVR